MMRLSPAQAPSLVTSLSPWILGLCIGFAAPGAYAQSPSAFGGNIGLTSDYVYRGISQTAESPAVQGDVHYSTNGWTLGAWASHADLERDENGRASEIDLYVSRDWPLNDDWGLRVTASHYTYPNDPRVASYEYEELVTGVSFKSRLFATVAWTPNLTRYSNSGFVRNESALSYEIAAIQPFFEQLSGSAGIGYYDLPSTLRADYWFWNVGLAYSLGRTQIVVSYIDTDAAAAESFGYELTGSRWAGSVGWKF
jgi:uncharacterized protein (TIGR02001 family)